MEEAIRRVTPEIEASAVRQMKRRTQAGRKYLAEEVVLPGYIFFRAPHGQDALSRLPRDGILTVLRSDDMDWRLYGEDEKFARWVLSHGGLITLSEAWQEGDRIRIVSGPLKDLEGLIRRVDRRNRSCKIGLSLHGGEASMWLGYEIVRKVD